MNPGYTMSNKLSARQIHMMDEVSQERKANEITLKVAYQFHSNRLIEINRDHDKIWKEVLEQYNLPTDEGQAYAIKKIDGSICVVLKEKPNGQ